MVSPWRSVCLSVCLSIHISFPDDNLSKHQWIFTKPSMCIDIIEIWYGQIWSNFDGIICPRHAKFLFPDDNLGKLQWVFTKLGMCIVIMEI